MAGARQVHVLDLADVRSLEALRTPGHLELNSIALGQALEALGLNGAEMHEHVLAILLRDETIPLRIVEPLHVTLSHLLTSFREASNASVIPRHHDGGALLKRRTNKNAAGLEVLAALASKRNVPDHRRNAH